eukprot:gene15085-16641_t
MSIKTIASYTCAIFSVVVIILCLCTNYWIEYATVDTKLGLSTEYRFRSGLWESCRKVKMPNEKDFGSTKCFSFSDSNKIFSISSWIVKRNAIAAMFILALLITLIAFIFVTVYCITDKYYFPVTRSALLFLAAAICVVIGLAIYTDIFMFKQVSFSWSYGAGWSAAAMMVRAHAMVVGFLGQTPEMISSDEKLPYPSGQSPGRGVREYFYFIDHQGQLFLDDTKVKNFVTCFKDKHFLAFFFKRLKVNNTGIYSRDFPFISPCGKEQNFVRCEDRPIVFSHILENPEGGINTQHQDDKDNVMNSWKLVCNGIGPSTAFDFQPEKLFMLQKSGRIYHPAPSHVGGVGLIKSSLAIEISSNFVYKEGAAHVDPPTHFTWQNVEYELDQTVGEKLKFLDHV